MTARPSPPAVAAEAPIKHLMSKDAKQSQLVVTAHSLTQPLSIQKTSMQQDTNPVKTFSLTVKPPTRSTFVASTIGESLQRQAQRLPEASSCTQPLDPCLLLQLCLLRAPTRPTRTRTPTPTPTPSPTPAPALSQFLLQQPTQIRGNTTTAPDH